MLMWSATKINTASGFGSVAYCSMAFRFSSFEPGFDSPHEENLERRHQRRGARAIQDFSQVRLREVKFKDTEFAQIGRHQMLQNCFPALFSKKGFIADKNIDGLQLSRFDFRYETLSLRKRAHQKASRTFDTRVRAKSCESR